MPPTRFTWRHQYDDAADAVERNNTDIGDLGPSLTQQHFAKDADLNVIMKRMGVTDRDLPAPVIDPRFFGDFSTATDFRDALDATRVAQEHFNALPAELRARFNNDPVQLWTFVNDPAQTEEAIKLGILRKEPTAPPVDPKPVST